VATGTSSSSITLNWDASKDPSVTGYDVYEKVLVGANRYWHYVYNRVASNLTTNSDTLTGLTRGSHAYVVTDLNSSGQSMYSYLVAASTWIAPGLGDYVQLSTGQLWSISAYGSIHATAGLTIQVKPGASGTPLTFSITSGPSTASIDPNTGLLTYTPDPSEVGPVNITIEASNDLGSATQTIPFNVAAADPTLAKPTLTVSGTTATYTGQSQSVTATAYGTDGVTPVSGTYLIVYNGLGGGRSLAGTYQVLVTFISSDPNYGNASLLTSLTINQASPAFSNLSSPTITAGDATTTLSGNIAAVFGSFSRVYPSSGEYVIVTLNGVAEDAVVGAYGNFSASFATGSLPVGSYTITYDYAGDANFSAASTGSGTLTVIPTAAPQVTLNPTNVTTSAGDYATFTAAATGAPTPTVQWQVSTDGGQTWSNITGATTTTLSFVASTSQNGYHYRAVFTNRVGVATTTDGVLRVESDSGGGD
jgi:hypothetical protein